MKKLLIFSFVVVMMGLLSSCTYYCGQLEDALEDLSAAIDDNPALKNPALYVHFEAAKVAAENCDYEEARKNLDKFMTIGSQPKYEEIFCLFERVNELAEKCWLYNKDWTD